MSVLPEVTGVDVRHHDVRARDVRFHVAEAGPPDGDPIVLVHGWPSTGGRGASCFQA